MTIKESQVKAKENKEETIKTLESFKFFNNLGNDEKLELKILIHESLRQSNLLGYHEGFGRCKNIFQD